MKFGEKVKLLLKSEGITQKELAAEIKMNYSQVSNYISGYNKPSLDFIEKVIRKFPKTDLNWLLREDAHNLAGDLDLNSKYSRPYVPEELIEDMKLKLDKLQELLAKK